MNTIQQAVDEVLRQRRHKLAPVRLALDKSRDFAQNLRKFEMLSKEAAELHLPFEVRSLLESIPVKTILESASEAETALERAVQRLARDTVTIGVAGQARQGKSTLLKSLTGLDDNAIPTGGTDFCTAARSEIRNSQQTRATIAKHSRESFIRETVLPYYDAFKLSPTPHDFREFVNTGLPTLPPSSSSNDKNLYLTLADIHSSVGQVEPLLTGGEEDVALSDVRRYVTKDKGNREYLAVRKAIVEAPFPFSEMPAQLRLIDLPGLGEMALNIETELMRTVAEQADLVLVVKMPQATGAGWGAPDIGILDTMRRAVPDLELRDWIILALNHTNTAGHKNTDNIDSLLSTMTSRDLEGIMVKTCDCSQPDEVREEVVAPAMRLLMEKTGALDHIRLQAAEQAVERLRNTAIPHIEKLQAVLGANTDGIVDVEFDGKVREFLQDLRGSLREALDDIKREMSATVKTDDLFYREVERLVSTLSNAVGDETDIAGYHPWNVAELTGRLRFTAGEAEVRDRAASNTRLALAQFLASRLDPVFQSEVRQQKKRIAEKLLAQAPLLRFVSACEVNPVDAEGEVITMIGRIIPDRMPLLKNAFLRLGAFNYTYELNFHPLVREKLHRLDPDEKDYLAEDNMGHWHSYDAGSVAFKEVARQLRTALDSVAAEIAYSLVEERSASNMNLHNALYYSIKEFLDQILWSEGAEHEWKRLLHENRRRLWADDYAERDAAERAMSEIGQCANELKGAVAQMSL